MRFDLLELENGNKWCFQSKFPVNGVTERVSRILRLSLSESNVIDCIRYPYYPFISEGAYTFFDYAKGYLDAFRWLSERAADSLLCLDDFKFNDLYDLRLQLIAINHAIVLRNEICGGLLLHGVMLEYSNEAIILAGESGIGKTTAAIRVPDTAWKKHSDDLTLVVQDREGNYFAHPWPGTKAYTHYEIGYESTKGIPLRAVFYLMPHKKVAIKPLKTLEAFALTQEAANQAMSLPDPSIDPKGVGEIRKNRLKNITEFIRHIPCYTLRLNKTDPYWEVIEALFPDAQ